MIMYKKNLRLLGLIFMMILASFGVGLVGGVPMRSFLNQDKFDARIEMIDQKEEDDEDEELP